MPATGLVQVDKERIVHGADERPGHSQCERVSSLKRQKTQQGRGPRRALIRVVPSPAVATNSELDGWALADEYRRGDTLETIARRHGVSLWRVRSRLLAMDVELRPPGRRPAATMPRVMSLPMAALTREEGRRRYHDAAARGEIPAVGERYPHHTPPQAPIIRRPRSSRKGRMAAERQALASLTDDQWGEISAQLVAGLGGECVEADTGSTRGVRRNPVTGLVERF